MRVVQAHLCFFSENISPSFLFPRKSLFQITIKYFVSQTRGHAVRVMSSRASGAINHFYFQRHASYFCPEKIYNFRAGEDRM